MKTMGAREWNDKSIDMMPGVRVEFMLHGDDNIYKGMSDLTRFRKFWVRSLYDDSQVIADESSLLKWKYSRQ